MHYYLYTEVTKCYQIPASVFALHLQEPEKLKSEEGFFVHSPFSYDDVILGYGSSEIYDITGHATTSSVLTRFLCHKN